MARRADRAARPSRAAGAAGLVLTALLAGCAPAVSPAAPTEVEVDVYSGRQNPRWVMTDEELADLREAVQRLGEPSARATPHGGGLGFRGFVVHDVVLAGAAGPAELSVVDEAVIRRSGNPATWADPAGTVLALLLEDAQEHLDPADLAAVEEAVSRGDAG